MEPFSIGSTDRNWYHIVWGTARRRRLFKIPATARFCEQLIHRSLAAAGCEADVVWLSPTSVHLLIAAPPDEPKPALVRRLKYETGRALRRQGIVPARVREPWADGGWCASLRSPRSVNAVRHHLASRSNLGVMPMGVRLGAVWYSPQ
jgi:REP element-mobilizing transposase RayT